MANTDPVRPTPMRPLRKEISLEDLLKRYLTLLFARKAIQDLSFEK
jgi:hypothetical protein